MEKIVALLESTVKLIAIGAAAIFVFGLLFRMLFGKGSALNKALCAGIGVLCVYRYHPDWLSFTRHLWKTFNFCSGAQCNHCDCMSIWRRYFAV